MITLPTHRGQYSKMFSSTENKCSEEKIVADLTDGRTKKNVEVTSLRKKSISIMRIFFETKLCTSMTLLALSTLCICLNDDHTTMKMT